jgi:hypothetical protein
MRRFLKFKFELELRAPAKVWPTYYVSDHERDLVLCAFGSALTLKIGTGRAW